MFSDIAFDIVQKGNAVMVVCNRQKLVRQSANTLRKYGLKPYILMQTRNPSVDEKIIVASADTLRSRPFPPQVKMVIIDECHLASFTKVLDVCKEKQLHVLGVSATPVPNKTNLLHEYYQTIITTKPTIEHIKDGELVMDIYVKTEAGPDVSGLKTHKTAYGYDYSSKDLFTAFDKPKIYDGVVTNYLKYAKFKRAVCFCTSVEHSKKTAEAFRQHGISAAHIDGSDPEEVREKIQADFEEGKYHVLCNCAIYTFGWDCPSVEVVIVNRATASYELWRQMIGRGARPYGDKSYFLVIDQGGNRDRHGTLPEEIEWNLLPPDRKKKTKKGVAPVKSCINNDCGCLIPVQSTVCPICGTKQPQKGKGQLAEGSFVLEVPELISSPPAASWPKKSDFPSEQDFICATIEYAKNKGYNANYPIHIILKQATDEADKLRLLQEYSKAKHYSKGWAGHAKRLYIK